jgi:hypothetical protein
VFILFANAGAAGSLAYIPALIFGSSDFRKSNWAMKV